MAKEVEWKEQFNIGVDSIDKAHRKLFSIVRRLIYLSKNKNSGQWACAEGIKYFKSYAVKHFADEEAYMQSIGYKDYEIHKRLHDNMRYKTLPALEKNLVETEYSQEAIQHFLGICLGWLTAHIMIEDRAITGKISNKWKKAQFDENIEALESAIADTIQEIFKLQTDVVSEHYSGENFGKSIIDRLTYRAKDKEQIQIFFVFEEGLILQTVSALLGIRLKKVDKLVNNAVKELSAQLVRQLGIHFQSSAQYQLKSSHLLTMEQLQWEFHAGYPYYSLLFDTGIGYFAFCIKRQEDE